jgi:hypothetical protein
MASNLVAVIIPVYKQQPDANEVLSFKQCLAVLGNYPVIIAAPVSLNTQAYETIYNEAGELKTERFDDYYFSGIAGYNQLMLSTGFYKRFIKYRYILIYQLDAYVFKDELTYWCQLNYDFIGAPNLPHKNQSHELQFLKGYSRFISFINRVFHANHQISNVGNGGFSLRKTKACYWLLTLLKSKIPAWGNNNEDGFFKYWGNLLHPFFRLPADAIALKFSVEHSPAESLKKLGNVLPFGCHAFEKYEPETWRPYIQGVFTAP